jgi:hypothetical protein
MKTTTELTNDYINKHPNIKDCLKHGIINYSKLSRKISKELNIQKKTSLEAILIACRRYEQKLNDKKILEEKIIEILSNSELEIKNKIVVAIINKNSYMEKLIDIERKIRGTTDIFYAIEGTKVFTVIISEKYLNDIHSIFNKNIIKTTKELAMITIKSSRDMENTPGVVAYITSLFNECGINIVETMSCWTDTIFVVLEEDISTVMNFLRF